MTRIPDLDARCREIMALIERGGGVCESCRAVGVSDRTFQRWRLREREATATP